jgi:hypothetical protein
MKKGYHKGYHPEGYHINCDFIHCHAGYGLTGYGRCVLNGYWWWKKCPNFRRTKESGAMKGERYDYKLA